MYCYPSRTFKLQSILNYNSTPSRSIIKFYLPTIHPSNRRKIILKPASRFNTLTPFHFPPPRSMYCCVFYITKPESVPMNLARTTLRANLRLLLLCCSSRLFFPLASVLRLLHHIFSTIRITYVDGKLLQDTPHQYHIIRSAWLYSIVFFAASHKHETRGEQERTDDDITASRTTAKYRYLFNDFCAPPAICCSPRKSIAWWLVQCLLSRWWLQWNKSKNGAMKNKSYLLNGRNNCVCTHINLYTYIDSSSLHHPIQLSASISSRSSSIIWVIELPRSQTLSIVVIRASEQVKYRNQKGTKWRAIRNSHTKGWFPFLYYFSSPSTGHKTRRCHW